MQIQDSPSLNVPPGCGMNNRQERAMRARAVTDKHSLALMLASTPLVYLSFFHLRSLYHGKSHSSQVSRLAFSLFSPLPSTPPLFHWAYPYHRQSNPSVHTIKLINYILMVMMQNRIKP